MSLKHQKSLKHFFIEAFLDAKPGRGSARLLTNEIMRVDVLHLSYNVTIRYTKILCKTTLETRVLYMLLVNTVAVLWGENVMRSLN
jgi:hypothetical protein